MATRFYLPLSGTPGSSPTRDLNWAGDAAAFQSRPLVTVPSDSALATLSVANGPLATNRYWQGVSAPLEAQTISGNLSAVIKGQEAAVGNNGSPLLIARVTIGDTSSERGDLGNYAFTELPTAAATRIINTTVQNITVVSAGDRIVLEWGVDDSVGDALGALDLRLGDPVAGADFALTAGLTTDLRPWVEFSQTLLFAAAPTAPAVTPDYRRHPKHHLRPRLRRTN